MRNTDKPNSSERRAFPPAAAAEALTTSLFTGNVRGANDRMTDGFLGVGMMGSENPRMASGADRSGLKFDWDDRTQTLARGEARKYLYREACGPWKLEVG